MNKIKTGLENGICSFNAEDRKRLLSEGTTAFVGRRIEMSESEIFLITFSCIVLASDPYQTWSAPAQFVVDRWVDVEISVVGGC